VRVIKCDARDRASTKSTLISLVEHAMAVHFSALSEPEHAPPAARHL
jgi:hypothetical protein